MDRPVTLPDTAPAVIIGGGIIGVSALYHLAKRGIPAVLLERKRLACGTTWHAAGIVGQLRESGAQTELAKYTARLYAELEGETGQATGYRQNGTLHLALSDIRQEQLLRNHDHARRMQVESRLLTRDEIAGLWPMVALDGVLGGFLVPSNGQVNPLDVTQALARGARAMGAQICEDTEALRIVTSAGRVSAVETGRGTVACDRVLLAGGMWSARFAAAHGVTLPLHAAEHFYIVTEPVPGLPRSLPGLVVAEERLYAKEDAGKLLIGGFEARGKAWGQGGIPADFAFDELPFDMDHLEPLFGDMFRRFPGLEGLGIRTFFNGPESFTPDGRPYVGPAPEMPGLFVAAGMNSNGILNAGGIGLTMAAWMAEGMPPRAMGSMLAARAHPFQRNRAYLAKRVTEAVGFHYGLHWPGRQVDTARGLRRVPLHDRLVAAGALMSERIGWEVPMLFDPAAPGWPQRASLGWQDWSPRVRDECLAARDTAVLIDQSMYGKLVVQGPDAARALNRVSGARIDGPVGRSVYTQFLNARGGIEADVTVTRTAPQVFVVITGHPSQIRDAVHIRAHADPGWQFEVFDATAAYGLLSLHGPASRAILQAVSGDDLSDAALPFGAACEIDAGFARAWAIRRSFLGELGYELLVSAEFTGHLDEVLTAAGAPHGLRRAGMFALNACRLEKGFRHFGLDIGEEDTPHEAGLGFAVDLDRPDFVGRAALAAQQGAVPANRLVCLRLDAATAEAGPWLMHNEPVWQGDALVGHVTSGGWGWRIGAMVGLAALHRAEGVTRDWLAAGGFAVQVAGQLHPATLQAAPFYDPAGARMRG
jgi:4-methylaminobutanoate oxidase (formaldehyde-forming)